MSVSIQRVRFEHHRNAIGIGESSPRISWRFESTEVVDWKQGAYEIEVVRAGSPDAETYTVESDESVLVPWPSRPLATGESASVRVRALRRAPHDDFTPWSEPAVVEAGLLERKDWSSSSLISASHQIDKSQPRQPVLFRRAFPVEEKPVRAARLYITAHGVYEAHVNGQRVGDHILAPGWTSYRHRLVYQTFDVTSLIRRGGHNVLTAQVAEGWFCGRLGYNGGVRNIYGDTMGLIARLVITADDGATTEILSDRDWTWSTGAIVTSEIYDGEVCDLSLEPQGWQLPTYDDAAWGRVITSELPAAALVAPTGPPVREVETLAARRVFTTPSGKTVVDFAQNLVGWVRVQLKGPKGREVQLQFAEELENGEVATRPLRRCKARDTIRLSGDDQTWEPKFTFHGFRYVQVDGLAAADEFDLSSLVAVVIHSDMEETGSFECSHPELNQLHRNIRWGMKGNFLSIPTDCPQRDERLGWTGDIHVFAPTANYLYDTAGFLQSWLRDVAAEQLEDGGATPPVFCPDTFPDETRLPTAIWGDVAVVLPWTLYEAFADEDLLQKQLESMLAWVDRGIPRDGRTGLWDPDAFQFGDWLDPRAPPDEPGRSVTDPVLVADAYLIHVTALMQKICVALGLRDQAATYGESAATLKTAFQRQYISAAGRVVGDSQTALALAIHFQLFKTEEQQRAAASRLKRLILRDSRFKIDTGFAGTPILGHALSRAGEAQLFYRMLYHRKAPSWLYQVSMGATTMWERWDSKLPDGRVNPGEMTSFNHYALGSVASWMHAHIAGLSPLEPGWRRFLVAPVPGGDLTSAKGSFLSPYGLIAASWTIEGGSRFSLTVRVPPNTTAEVRLPSGSVADGKQESQQTVVVGSGTHQYNAAYEPPVWPPRAIHWPHGPADDDDDEL